LVFDGHCGFCQRKDGKIASRGADQLRGNGGGAMDAGLKGSLKFIKRLQFVCLAELVC